MSYTSDPLEVALAHDERLDDAKAAERGDRLRALASAVVDDLIAAAFVPARYAGPSRVHVFTVLADSLYGNAPIEIPRGLGSTRRTDATSDTPDAA